MTTNQISEFGPRHGYVAVSTCPAPAIMPRVRRLASIDAGWSALAAGGLQSVHHKFTCVSVPGCRGIT